MSFVPKPILHVVEPEETTDRDLALEWINKYRFACDLPSLTEIPEGGLREACPDITRLHRNQARGHGFILTQDDDQVRRLTSYELVRVRAKYHMAGPDSPEEWDLELPVYMYDWILP